MLFLEAEQQAVRKALHPWLSRRQIFLHISYDSRLSTFKHLLQYPWDLVILSGHVFLKPAKACWLWEEETHSVLLDASSFATLFRGKPIQCVVLAACYTAQHLGSLTDLTTALANVGIPHIVGIQKAILDRAASIFIHTFCVALVQGVCIGLAMGQARQALSTLLQPNEQWCDAQGNPSGAPESQSALPILISDNLWHVFHYSTESKQINTDFFTHSLLMGRQRELQWLDETISTIPSSFIVIQGAVGMGKTALLTHWIENLQIRGEFEYLGHQLNDQKPTQGKWLIWLDNADCLNTCQRECLSQLQRFTQYPACILLTSRTKLELANTIHYELSPLTFEAFSRYVRYLGFPYSSLHIRLLYRGLQGNLNGLTLLNSLPICLTKERFLKQLAILQRYVQAQSRQTNSQPCRMLVGMFSDTGIKG